MKAAIGITWIAMIMMFVSIQWSLSGHEHGVGAGRVEKEFELAVPMGRIQAFADKLYFSGKAENWPLAAFYLHEIEEQAEQIVAAGAMEDGVDVSALTSSFLIPHIESLEDHVQARSRDLFLKEYDQLVSRCNACHEATQHGFLKIITPSQSMFRNQDYVGGPVVPAKP